MKSAFLGMLALIGLLGLLLGTLVAMNVVELPTLAPQPTKAELEKYNSAEALSQLECQTVKVEEDMGREAGLKYVEDEFMALMDKPNSTSFLQWELAKDGYYCTPDEMKDYPSNGVPWDEELYPKTNGNSQWDKDQVAASEASASASASASAEASASADTSYTAEEDAIKGAAVYYNAASVGDWATTYNLLSGQSQMVFTAAEWTTANNNLGTGTYEVLSATQLYGNDFEVEVLVNGSEYRYTTFERGSDGTFYRVLSPEDIDMFSSALY